MQAARPPPVKTCQQCLGYLQAVEQIQHVVGDGRLLPGSHGRGGTESGRPVAAQVGDEDAMAACGETCHDSVETVRVVGEPVEEHDGHAACRAADLAGDVQL